MFGKKNISVWNSPFNRTTLKWLDKSTHVWEKPLSICIFTKWQKPNMCGFYQTLTKYKCVWKKPHMFVKNQTCVSFSIQGVVLFVFASVFRICLKDLLHNLPIFHFRGDHAMSEVKNIFKSALEKITCLGIPTHVWKNPHMLKTKTAKTKSKQNNSKHGHPLDFCSHYKDSVDGFVSIFD